MLEPESLEDECRLAVVLGAFIRAWGQPASRLPVRGPLEAPAGVYAFPSGGKQRVARLATCGLSSQPRCRDVGFGWELLLALPPDWGGNGVERASAYLADLAVWSIRPDVTVRRGATTVESRFAPEGWPAAVLLDEPLCEPEELAVLLSLRRDSRARR